MKVKQLSPSLRRVKVRPPDRLPFLNKSLAFLDWIKDRVRPSVRPSVRPTVSPMLFSNDEIRDFLLYDVDKIREGL